MKSPAKSFLPGVLGALLSLSIGAAASADQNLQIDEVMAGAFGRPELQFVELRLGSCEPRQWAGTARLAFFDAAGTEVGEFIFPGDPSVAGCFDPGRSVLVATQALADLPGVPVPDFIMPPLLVPGSGKVCFQGLPGGEPANLCLSYGDFTGDSEQGSPGNAPDLVPTRICSVQRQALFGDFSEPNFNEDFGLGEPRPVGQELLIPGRFHDVSLLSPFGRFAEALFNAGVTAGCGNGNFCPQAAVTRDQMAVFLLLAKEGAGFTPPACTAPVFADVPCSNPFAPWINELAARGITGGCGGGAGMGNYCPGGAVTREQMAVFLLLTLEGAGFTPPACTVPVFGDVPCGSPFAPWIHELAQRGVTGGCGGAGMGNYCPGGAVTREQMAVFLSSAFALPVPSFDCSDGPVPRDDHGDEPANATPLAVGVPVTGTLETFSDEDVFSFTAQEGEVFYVDARLLSDNTSLLVLLLDANGNIMFSNNPFAPEPHLAIRAFADGTFFVKVSPIETRQGRYQVTLTGPIADDHGDDAATATPIAAGGPASSGVFEAGGDTDVFAFDVQAGGVYAVEARGLTGLSLAVLGVDGETPIATDFGSFFGDLEVVALFKAPAAGTVFAELSHVSGALGAYEIGVRGPLPDADGEAGIPVPLTPGVPFFGELPPFDVDSFSFPAGVGEVFVIETRRQLNGPLVLELLGTDGATILQTSSFGQPIVFLVPATGTYFARLRASSTPNLYRILVRGPVGDDHGDDTGSATPLAVGAPPVAGHIELPGDVDVFTFTVAVGGFYRAVVTDPEPGLLAFPFVQRADGNPIPSSLFLEPGTYFVSVSASSPFSTPTGTYRIAVQGPVADDHGNNPADGTLLVPGGPAVAGAIQVQNDEDFFAFDAVAGESFRIKVVPGEPIFLLGLNLTLFDPNGAVLDSEGISDAFVTVFTAPSSGRFFLQLRGSTVGYQISLGPAIDDDHGDTPEEATLLTVDGPPTNGFHQFTGFFGNGDGDVDVFAFDAAAGETLTIETSGLGPASDTVIELVDTDGSTVLAVDDDGAGALASRITFTFPSAGRYFVRTFQQSNSIGIYQIAVRSEP